MGLFGKLLGRPDPVRPWNRWDELDLEKRRAGGLVLLQRVAERLGLQGATTRSEGSEVFLQGSVEGIRFRVKLDIAGSAGVELKYKGQRLESIDLTHDPSVRRRPEHEQEPFEEGEARVWVSDVAFTCGSHAREEAERFQALPEELQQRVISAMLRCKILYFRSRSEDHESYLRGTVPEFDDPVAWLSEVLDVSLAVARRRIAEARAAREAAPKAPRSLRDLCDIEDLDQRAKAVEQLIASLACAREKGASVVPRKNDGHIDVRWTTQGVPVRILIDFTGRDLGVQARADGVVAEFHLDYDKDVTIEDEKPEDDWADAADVRVFLAQGVFVTGSKESSRAQVELLRALPAPLLEELLGSFANQQMHALSLSEGFLSAEVADLDEAKPRDLARAERVAEMLARISSGLPRGGVPHLDVAAVRCNYCRALCFPGPGHEKCAHCGAPL